MFFNFNFTVFFNLPIILLSTTSIFSHIKIGSSLPFPNGSSLLILFTNLSLINVKSILHVAFNSCNSLSGFSRLHLI